MSGWRLVIVACSAAAALVVGLGAPNAGARPAHDTLEAENGPAQPVS